MNAVTRSLSSRPCVDLALDPHFSCFWLWWLCFDVYLTICTLFYHSSYRLQDYTRLEKAVIIHSVMRNWKHIGVEKRPVCNSQLCKSKTIEKCMIVVISYRRPEFIAWWMWLFKKAIVALGFIRHVPFLPLYWRLPCFRLSRTCQVGRRFWPNTQPCVWPLFLSPANSAPDHFTGSSICTNIELNRDRSFLVHCDARPWIGFLYSIHWST